MEKFLWLQNNLFGGRKQTAKLLRSLSLIAKPEASPGPIENRASNPGHLPSRAYLGLGRQQSRAWHSRAKPFGAFTVQLNCGYVLLYSCSKWGRGLSVGWTMLTAGKGKQRTAGQKQPAVKPCPAAPAREYGINNTSIYRVWFSQGRAKHKTDPLLHTVTHSCDPGPSQDGAAGVSIPGR